MSGSFSYHHVKRTFRRNSVNPLPVAGYRLRLLRRCLDSQELSLLITACSFPTSLTVTGTPTESTSAGGDVLELLEFLQHDAVPYEVKAPPYSQNPGGSRRKPAKRIRAGNASRASPSGEAAGASKHDKNRKSQLSQAVQGAYRKGASGDATKHTNSSVANAATDATAATAAAAAAAIGSPVLNLAARNSPFLGSTRRTSPATGAPKPGPEQTSRAFEDPIAAPLQAVPQVTDPNRNGAVEFSIKGGNVLPGQDNQLPELQEAVWRLENTLQFVPADGDGSSTGTSSSSSIASMPSAQVPEDRREAAGATAAELAKPGLQLLATATAAATAATAGTSLASGDSVAPTGSPPGVSSRTGSSSRTSGSSRTDNIVQSTAVATAATAVAAAPPASTASTTESILAGRRAAVLWQWKQFLGPREGPHGRAAVTAQGPATATATAAAARAMTSESTTVPATTPLATATSLRQGLATATATATSVSSSQTSPLKSARPAVQVVVPGIAPPPPPDVPNAATGTAGYNSEAAEEASVPPPQVARVPAALLPLTLQGRISLMEAAAAAAAKEDAIASARRSSENVGTRNDLRGRGPRGIGAAPQGGRRDPPVAAVHLPVVADTPDVTAVKSGEQNSDRRTSPENPRGAATASPFKDVRKDQSTAPTAAAAAVAAAAAGLTPSALAPKFVVDDENGSNRGSRAQPAAVQEDTTAAAPLPSVKVSRVGRRDQRPAATLPPALVTADPAVGLSPEVSTARDLFANLVRYLPSSREDGPALLSPYVRYQYTKYQDAAVAATTHADLLLRPLGVQQLSYIAAAYAAAGHRYEPFLCMLTSVAADKMETQRPRHARSSLAAAAPSTPSSPAAPLTFRTACVMLTALARLRFHDSRLTAAIGRWLAAALRSGSVTPRARWKGTWLAAALWAYATLERISARDAASGPAAGDGHGFAGPAPAAATVAAEVSATGAVLFTEAVEAIRVDPGWIHLMDCREALWALWALKVAAAMYSPTEGTATEPATPPVLRSLAMKVSYTPQPLVELQLLERAASQLDQLDPGQLAEAYAVAAEAGFGADRDMLAALRRCTLARVAAVRPQPLAVMVASLAVLQIQDVTWLTALAAACRNQMINMKAEQIVVVLHSFAVALRYYYLPLFHAAAVMCTLPGFARLERMPAGDLVRLSAAYAAVGHYEAILMRRTAERILALGSDATSWQRASVVHSCARLSYRSNPLLRAVATEAPGLPPGPLALVAAAYGHLQFRPRGLLPALHNARVTEWKRMGLTQRAALCWSLLVLTGGLAGRTSDVSDGSGGTSSSRAVGADFSAGKSDGADDGVNVDIEKEDEHQANATATASGSPIWPRVRADSSDSMQRRRRRQQQHKQLAEALSGYLHALCATDWRSWPVSDHHHLQLLVACSVLAWRERGQQQPEGLPKKEKKEKEKEKAQVGGAGGGNDGDGVSGGDGGGGAVVRVSPAWAILAAPLHAALQRLPAAATRRAVVTHHRLRQAALGPWATQVADVVRQVLDGAVAADAAALAQSGRTWLGSLIACSNGVAAVAVQKAEAMQKAAPLLRGATVTHGSLLCEGAFIVDVGVEVELDMGLGLGMRPDEQGPMGILAPPPVATTVTVTETATATGSLSALGDSVGKHEGSSGGGEVCTEAPTLATVRQRRRVRIALELCVPPPSGAGNAAAATGLGGGGVVRNSRWLISGSAALRRRLLTGLGWHVVVVRERTWQGLRSSEQQLRAVEAILRRAVWQAAKGEQGEGVGE